MWPGKPWLRILVLVVGSQVLFIKIVTLKACQVFRAALPITRLECWGFGDGMISSLCSLHSSISLSVLAVAPLHPDMVLTSVATDDTLCDAVSPRAKYMNCV